MSELLHTLTRESLAQYFDHTQLAASATEADIEALCRESLENRFKMVAINPVQVPLCSRLLHGSGVHVGAAVGFPLGQNTIEEKVFSAGQSIENGAQEIDYVINITALKSKDYAYLEREMAALVAVCREQGAVCKVIFENCYLTGDEKRAMCEIALAVGPDFVKTSTGFGSGGATLDDVRLMKRQVGDKIKVKAAGGIRTLDSALQMIEAGAERIGSSASVKILGEFCRLRQE